MTSQRLSNLRQKKALWIAIVVVLSVIVLVGLVALTLFVNEAAIHPDRDPLDPLPETLHEVGSLVVENNGGGRVPADLYIVFEPRPRDRGGEDGIKDLNEHLGDRGWSPPQPIEWGFSSKFPEGPTLDYGLLDDYLNHERRQGTDGLLDESLVQFLEDHEGSNRLLLIL